MHFDFFQAIAFAGLTASAFDIKAKSPRPKAAELGFTRAEANSLRGAYREKLAEFQ